MLTTASSREFQKTFTILHILEQLQHDRQLEGALSREDASCSDSLGALRCIFSRLAQRKCCSRQLKAVQIRDLWHCWFEEGLWSVQVRSHARWCSLGCGGRLRCFTGSETSQYSHVSPWNIGKVLLCSSPVQSGTWRMPPELLFVKFPIDSEVGAWMWKVERKSKVEADWKNGPTAHFPNVGSHPKGEAWAGVFVNGGKKEVGGRDEGNNSMLIVRLTFCFRWT